MGLTACGKDKRGNNGEQDAGTDTTSMDTAVDDAADSSGEDTARDCPNRDNYEFAATYYGRFDSVQECKAARPLPPSGILSGIPDIQAAIALDRIAYD